MLLDEEKKKRIGVCPEDWEDSFGSEFYDYVAENELYYLPQNTDLGLSSRGSPLTNQLPFEIDWQRHLEMFKERKVSNDEQ